MLNYCVELDKVFCDTSRQVKATVPEVADGPLHSIHPGDFVVIKDFKRKHWRQKRWQGPYQVLLVIHTAVKVGEKVPWIHGTHCQKVPEPLTGEPFPTQPENPGIQSNYFGPVQWLIFQPSTIATGPRIKDCV